MICRLNKINAVAILVAKEINIDDSYSEPGDGFSSVPSTDDAVLSPLTGKLSFKGGHTAFETHGQYSVKYNLGKLSAFTSFVNKFFGFFFNDLNNFTCKIYTYNQQFT